MRLILFDLILFHFFVYTPAFIFHSHRIRRRSCFSSNANETSSISFLAPSGILSTASDQKYMQQLSSSNSVGIIPTGPEGLSGNVKEPNALSRATRSANTLKYFKKIDTLAPNDMLLKFAKAAPMNVQEAAKSTVMNILGSMPNYALDAVLITTNKKLANLLYQMQITGYMFKNAEYRMSLTRLLKGLPKLPSAAVVNQGNVSFNPLESKAFGEIEVLTSTGEKGAQYFSFSRCAVIFLITFPTSFSGCGGVNEVLVEGGARAQSGAGLDQKSKGKRAQSQYAYLYPSVTRKGVGSPDLRHQRGRGASHPAASGHRHGATRNRQLGA